MKYIDIQWLHSNTDYPVRMVLEMRMNRYEQRKLEFFSDGRVTYASKAGTSGNTVLSKESIPHLHEINLQAEFHGVAIDKASFEKLWIQHVGAQEKKNEKSRIKKR